MTCEGTSHAVYGREVSENSDAKEFSMRENSCYNVPTSSTLPSTFTISKNSCYNSLTLPSTLTISKNSCYDVPTALASNASGKSSEEGSSCDKKLLLMLSLDDAEYNFMPTFILEILNLKSNLLNTLCINQAAKRFSCSTRNNRVQCLHE